MKKRQQVRGQGTIHQRGKWWHVFYSINGKKYREAAKTQNREEAVAFLQRRLGAATKGEAIPPDRATIGDLLDLLRDEYSLRGRKSAYIAELKIQRYLLPAFGKTKVVKFSTAQLTAYIKQRQQVVKSATVNRELTLLHRAFTLGFDAHPPLVGRVPRFPKLPEDEARSGFLRWPEYQRLLKELPTDLQMLLVFGYHLGMRKSALLRLKWAQVDFAAGLIYLQRKRSEKHIPQAVPIYGDMADFLARQPRDSEYLFARGAEQIKDFRAGWKLACVKAGIPDLLFHDLRRTAARNLRRAGIPESVVTKITGHKTRAMFERYNIVDEDHIRDIGRRAEGFRRSLEAESAQRVTGNNTTATMEHFDIVDEDDAREIGRRADDFRRRMEEESAQKGAQTPKNERRKLS